MQYGNLTKVANQNEAMPIAEAGSFYFYLVKNQPEQLRSILLAAGIGSTTTEADLYKGTITLVTQNPEYIDKLMAIHPDYDEIVDHYQKHNVPQPQAAVQPASPNFDLTSLLKLDQADHIYIKALMFIVLVAAVIKLFKA